MIYSIYGIWVREGTAGIHEKREREREKSPQDSLPIPIGPLGVARKKKSFSCLLVITSVALVPSSVALVPSSEPPVTTIKAPVTTSEARRSTPTDLRNRANYTR